MILLYWPCRHGRRRLKTSYERKCRGARQCASISLLKQRESNPAPVRRGRRIVTKNPIPAFCILSISDRYISQFNRAPSARSPCYKYTLTSSITYQLASSTPVPPRMLRGGATNIGRGAMSWPPHSFEDRIPGSSIQKTLTTVLHRLGRCIAKV